jgi:hypothetical protein
MTWRDRSESGEAFTVACLSGAIAKCAYWGFLPWAKYTKDTQEHALEPFHRACVRALRAEFDREDPIAYTCVGTAVDLYDRLGLLQKTEDQGFEFESQWAADGPVCRKRSRMVGDDARLTALGVSAQEDCTEPTKHGWKEGALLAVASRTTNKRPDTREDSCPAPPPGAQASR